ncbi:MAG: hypothetical protein IKI97_13755 [Clostridia bacterium]|nr:hypothetical protein [Clostridia bacterium]
MKKLGFRFLIFSAIFACLALCSSAMAQEYTEVVITGNTNYSEVLEDYPTGALHIAGGGNGAVLVLDNETAARDTTGILLDRALIIENITIQSEYPIFADYYPLYIGDNVVTSSALTIYGGKIEGDKSQDIPGNTNIEIHSGTYANIYGGGIRHIKGDTNVTILGNTKITGDVYGGCGNGYRVTGSTNVTFGGNASCDEIFGGGNGGAVTKSTNINFNGGTAKFIYGTGNGVNLQSCTTNINISGGTVDDNVFGGGGQTGSGAVVNTNITMTGGTVEGIFGGNAVAGGTLTGNTHITLTGGEVTRRVYSGCYNEVSLFGSYESSNYVNGTTTLIIGPNVNLVTESDMNIGVFAGSRLGSKNTSEKNILVFANGSYAGQYGEIGEQGSTYKNKFNSYHDYILNCSGDDKDDYIDVVVESGELKFKFTSDNRKVTVNGTEYTLNTNGEKTQTVSASAMNSGNTPTEVIFSGEPLAKVGAIDLTDVVVTLGRSSGTPIAGNELKLVIKDTVGNILGEAKLENAGSRTGEDGTLTLGVSEQYTAFNEDFYGEKIRLVLVKNGYASVSVEVDTADFLDDETYRATEIGSLGANFVAGHGDIKASYKDDAGDGIVDIEDYIRLIRGFSKNIENDADKPYIKLVDLDEDGSVGVTDLAIIKKNFGFSNK